MKKLLLIEDDVALGQLLIEYLTPEGYGITHVTTGELGLEKINQDQDIDLVLLDVMLPTIDGFTVLRRLRQAHTTPVLMLTAKGDDFDKIYGLEAGADDYLAKPFNHRELSARIKSILRRTEVNLSQGNSEISIADLTIKASARTVHYLDQLIDLTGTEFSILQLLINNAGELISKEAISEQVLGRPLAAYDRSIDMHVSNLRKKIAAHTDDEKIKTVRGVGYLLLTS